MIDRRKLTDEQVTQARLLRESGETFAALGKQFDVSGTTIRLYLSPGVREADRKSSKLRKRLQWDNDSEFRKAKKECNREYQRTHKATSTKRSQARKARYRKNHKADFNAWESARRAMLFGATIGNLAEIKAIYRRAKEDPKVRCYLCGKLIPKGHRHVDHITPLVKGGAHRPSNLAVACDTCNQRKHTKLPAELGVLL